MSRKKYSYLDHLVLTAKKYEVEEYLYYETKGRKLTAKQIELILLRNGIKIPTDETPRLSKEQVRKESYTGLFRAAALVTIILHLFYYQVLFKKILHWLNQLIKNKIWLR